MSSVPALSVEDLSVEFRTRGGVVKVLDQVSFTVAKGESVAVVGESGSGKSVTAYAVMGILDRAGRVSAGTAGTTILRSSSIRCPYRDSKLA